MCGSDGIFIVRKFLKGVSFLERKIPKCMSTQHPDNVNTPFFAENPELGGEDEITEAYYVFSHLSCDEQMWDCEGKEVDDYVVKKLLSRYESFFREKVIGKDVFITLRVPNPTVEKDEAKILLETLESIPRSFDTAKIFYEHEVPPIFEVILPMTTSVKCLNRIYWYYRDFVVGKQNMKFRNEDVTIAEWIGEFKPGFINVIPLFEDWEHILNAHTILREYVSDKNVPYLRVFFARSDPAMNYGLISAVMLVKIALQRAYKLSEELGIEIYPIVGVGSAPFRGNMKPSTVERVIKEYPSVQTFTIQSAFKYDNNPEDVREAVKKLLNRNRGLPHEVNEEKVLELMERYTRIYKEQLKNLAGIINEVAKYVPKRRKRKLHTGLFGYSREVEGLKLPRVITFTAALYSIGIPPEILGLNAFSKDDLRFIKTIYISFEDDLADALKYVDFESELLPEELKNCLRDFEFTRDDSSQEHVKISKFVRERLRNKSEVGIQDAILRMGHLRRFLG